MSSGGQRGAMERLVRLMSVLSQAGDDGVSATALCRVGGFGQADPISQLTRELRYLRAQGWQIENITGESDETRYRMVKGDNRLRVALTPAQRAALQRAALLADRDDLVTALGLDDDARPVEVSRVSAHTAVSGPGQSFDVVVGAVRRNALLRFRYKGKARVVHPASVLRTNGTWYLTGLEEGGEVTKLFVLSRMSDVGADAPGTAEPVAPEQRRSLHPMHWPVDPPTEVTVRCRGEYLPDLHRWLSAPRDQREVGDGWWELDYVVTHREALRSRLQALGTRVVLVGPDDVREELLSQLREMAGI